MKRKFKIKISKASEVSNYYQISYSNNYLMPIYKTMYVWSDYFQEFSVALFSLKDAKDLVKSIDSVDYFKQHELRQESIMRKSVAELKKISIIKSIVIHKN